MKSVVTTRCAQTIFNTLRKFASKDDVFMCIGTNTVVADSLGPRVGKLLNESMSYPLTVYGMGSSNITAQNLQQAYDYIKKAHPNKRVVVIDSAVGNKNAVGFVQVAKTGVQAGKATGKIFNPMGDVAILGIVSDGNMSNFYKQTPSQTALVNAMAYTICQALVYLCKV